MLTVVDLIAIFVMACIAGWPLMCVIIEAINTKEEPPRRDWMTVHIAKHTGENPDDVKERVRKSVEEMKKQLRQ